MNSILKSWLGDVAMIDSTLKYNTKINIMFYELSVELVNLFVRPLGIPCVYSKLILGEPAYCA